MSLIKNEVCIDTNSRPQKAAKSTAAVAHSICLILSTIENCRTYTPPPGSLSVASTTQSW